MFLDKVLSRTSDPLAAVLAMSYFVANAKLVAFCVCAHTKKRRVEVCGRLLTQMLMDLGPNVYQEDFERAFLKETAEFYQV